MPSSFKQQLARAKADNLGHLLLRTARLVDGIAIAAARKKFNEPNLRQAHLALMPHLDLEGTRLTELARRLGISKQAVSQRVDELEQMGVVERVSDDKDARAKRIKFTRRGRRSLLQGLGVFDEIEAVAAEDLGELRLRRLKRDLSALLAWVEAQPQ